MINSCGIILVNKNGKFLLLKNKDYYDFPKGENEEGESFLQTALRELEEETGITNINLIGTNRFSTEPYRHGKKIAHYFLAYTDVDENSVILKINPKLGFPEHDAYFWLNNSEVLEKLNERVRMVFMRVVKFIVQ